jgi:hypothetical protein
VLEVANALVKHTPRRRTFTFRDFMMNAIDDTWALREVFKQIAQDVEAVPADLNFPMAARLYRGVQGRANHAIEFGWMEFDSLAPAVGTKSLRSIIDPIDSGPPVPGIKGTRLDAFRAYIVSRRVVELSERGIKAHGKNQTERQLNDYKQIAQELEGVFEQARLELFEYQAKGIDYLRDSGVISAEQAAILLEHQKNYIPLQRDVSGQAQLFGPTGKGQPRSPIRRIHGSSLEIFDPIESIIKATHTIIERAEKNELHRRYVDFMLENGRSDMAELVPKPIKKTTVTDAEKAEFIKKLEKEGHLEGLSKEAKEGLESIYLEELEVFRTLPVNQKEGMILVMREGREEWYRIPPDIALALENAEPRSLGPVLRAFGTPARALRGGTVSSPEFQIRNLMRDTMVAFLQSDHGFQLMGDTFWGIFAAARRGELYQEFQRSGALMADLRSLEARYSLGQLERIEASTHFMKQTRNVITSPYHAMLKMAQLTEEATRIAEFSRSTRGVGPRKLVMEEAFADLRAMKAADRGALLREAKALPENFGRTARGLNPRAPVPGGLREALQGRPRVNRAPLTRAQMEQGGLSARDVSIDFMRRGMFAQQMNALIPFLTPGIGGITRMGETFKKIVDDPKGFGKSFAWKATVGIVAPSVILEILNTGEEGYDQLPSWERDLFWNFAFPATDPETGEEVYKEVTGKDGVKHKVRVNDWYKIAKPFQYGILFGTLPQRVTRRIMDEEPGAFDDFAGTAWDATALGVVPQVLLPEMERWADKRFFTGSPLLGPSMQGLVPEMQTRPWTTELAKASGAILAKMPFFGEGEFLHHQTSPIHIENTVRAWTGANGATLMKLTSDALSAVGVLPPANRPADTLSDVPFFRAFAVRRPSSSSRFLKEFWEMHSESQARSASVDEAFERMDPVLAAELQSRWKGRLYDVSSIAKSLSGISRQIRMVSLMPPPEGADEEVKMRHAFDQRRQIDQLGRQAEALAKDGVRLMREQEAVANLEPVRPDEELVR